MVNGVPREVPERAFNILPRDYIEYSKDLMGTPFTIMPPRFTHRFSFFLPNAPVYLIHET